QEAFTLLTKGLELLKTLPEILERTQQELLLQTTLALALMATKGLAAPEVETTYTRARELCLQLGETSQLFPVLLGLWRFYNASAGHPTTPAPAEQLLRLAQSVPDPPFLFSAHHALGATLFFLGEFASAREHLEQGLVLYDSQPYVSHAVLYGQDPGVLCSSYAAFALWNLGYAERAFKRSQDALTLAQEQAHPY